MSLHISGLILTVSGTGWGDIGRKRKTDCAEISAHNLSKQLNGHFSQSGRPDIEFQP
jgi:hypothetical protein